MAVDIGGKRVAVMADFKDWSCVSDGLSMRIFIFFNHKCVKYASIDLDELLSVSQIFSIEPQEVLGRHRVVRFNAVVSTLRASARPAMVPQRSPL